MEEYDPNCLLYTDFVCDNCGDYVKYENSMVSQLFNPTT